MTSLVPGLQRKLREVPQVLVSKPLDSQKDRPDRSSSSIGSNDASLGRVTDARGVEKRPTTTAGQIFSVANLILS